MSKFGPETAKLILLAFVDKLPFSIISNIDVENGLDQMDTIRMQA